MTFNLMTPESKAKALLKINEELQSYVNKNKKTTKRRTKPIQKATKDPKATRTIVLVAFATSGPRRDLKPPFDQGQPNARLREHMTKLT